MKFLPRIHDCGEFALLLEFEDGDAIELSLAIENFCESLELARPAGLLEIVPAFSSLTLFFDPLALDRAQLLSHIDNCAHFFTRKSHGQRLFYIPVCYGGGELCDLDDLARHAGLTRQAIVELHCCQDYLVYMLGFLPGFAYLGDVPASLRFDRRATPRARVPKGSVALAAGLTAIYPLESPGGWHILGWTPVCLWNLPLEDEPLLKPGDKVRFYPVTPARAGELASAAAKGWRPQPGEQT